METFVPQILERLLPQSLQRALPVWMQKLAPQAGSLNWSVPVDESGGWGGVAKHKAIHDVFLRSHMLFPLADQRERSWHDVDMGAEDGNSVVEPDTDNSEHPSRIMAKLMMSGLGKAWGQVSLFCDVMRVPMQPFLFACNR